MRVIAGFLGGRTIDAPRGQRTHPMSDKARGGLFNALGDIDGLTILDAFAGSGALSIEAVSRGAKQATAIDIDKKAHAVMKKNVAELGLTADIKVIRANASGWSDNNPNAKFDIVVAAPPYDALQLGLIEKLTKHTKPGGLFILDWPGKLAPPQFSGLQEIATHSYGDAQVILYKSSIISK